MGVVRTEKQRERWRKHMHHSKLLSHSMGKGRTTWICENRDPHDVYLVIKSMCHFGFHNFYYRNIRKYFQRYNGDGEPLSRVRGVNVLHTLSLHGFVDIERNKNGNCSRYTRLFDKDDWEDVYQKVVKG